MNRWALYFLAAFTAAVLLALCGCERPTPIAAPPAASRVEVGVYLDPATTCEYLVTKGYGPTYAITPRMDRDGKQVCK